MFAKGDLVITVLPIGASDKIVPRGTIGAIKAVWEGEGYVVEVAAPTLKSLFAPIGSVVKIEADESRRAT